jgi:hypothetical protein
LADGSLLRNVYTNDALGVSYEFPSDWTANPDPKGPVVLDNLKPNGLANQCSKVLLLLSAPKKAERKFSSMAALLAIDPGCFRDAPFPQHLTDWDNIRRVADKIIKSYSDLPYFTDHAKISVTRAAGPSRRVVIFITGEEVINAVEGIPAPKRDPLHVNASFALAQSNGYWVAWAHIADDPSTVELKNAKVTFSDAASQ